MCRRTARSGRPQNGYGPLNGEVVFSHGVEFGVVKAQSRSLQEATNAWLSAIGQSNPDLRAAGPQQAIRLSQRSGLATPLVNASALGGEERVGLYTAFLAEGPVLLPDDRAREGRARLRRRSASASRCASPRSSEGNQDYLATMLNVLVPSS
jgi:hypothetical protein